MHKTDKHLYEFGAFRLDTAERLLLRGSAVVPLTPKAFEVLLALVEQPGKLLEKEMLLQAVWPDAVVEEKNLADNISKLRKALGEGEHGQKYIETIPKRGYRFVAAVRACPAETVATNNGLPVANLNLSEMAPPPPTVAAHTAVTPVAHTSAEIERHKRGVVALTLAVGAALAIAGYWFWPRVNRETVRGSATAPALKIRPFTSFPGLELWPSFSPDGNQLAFAWGGEKNQNFDIYVNFVEGGTPLRLTNGPAQDSFPVWFPDGRSLAFIRQTADDEGIFRIPALGGPEQELLSARVAGLTELSGLSLSADGKTLAFAGRSKNELKSIYLLAIETLETHQLVRPLAGLWDGLPAISPDGKTVAFYCAAKVFLVPVAGGVSRQMVSDSVWMKGLCWTTDGNEILYGDRRSAGDTLSRLSISGGAPVSLAGGEGGSWPAVSPRGNRLAWVKQSVNLDIWRFDSFGKHARARKLLTSTRVDASPQISADGQKVAFCSSRSGANEIWVANSDGTNPVQVTALGAPHSGVPRWSPDGRQIAFASNIEGQGDIYVVNTSGGKPRRLTLEPASDVRPSWSRDGRWIYFGSNRSGAWQVWKAPAEGGAATQLTQQGGREAFASPDGQFIYYTKGSGLTSLWRVPVAGGEEVKVLEPVEQGYWAISEQGVWFLNPNVRPQIAIEFYDFATKRATRMVTTEKSTELPTPGLAVSPDGKWLLLMLDEQSESDIMVMENFR